MFENSEKLKNANALKHILHLLLRGCKSGICGLDHFAFQPFNYLFLVHNTATFMLVKNMRPQGKGVFHSVSYARDLQH